MTQDEEKALYQRLMEHGKKVLPIFAVGWIMMVTIPFFINKTIGFLTALIYFGYHADVIVTHMVAIISITMNGEEVDLSQEVFTLFGKKISKAQGIMFAFIIACALVLMLRALSDWVGK